MCDDLIAAHQKQGLLGKFLPAIPRTGRAYAGTGDRIIAEIGHDPKRKGGVQIITTNPNPKAYGMALDIVLRKWSGPILDRTTIKFVIGSRKTISKRIPFSLPASTHEGFRVAARNTPADILVVDLVVPPRKLLGTDPEEPGFEILLAGSPAVKGWLKNLGTKLALRFQVEDSKVTLGKLPWSGSSLELFIAPDNSTDFIQIILVPTKGSHPPKLVDARCKPVAGAKLRQKKYNSGYEIEVTVPKASLHLSPITQAFLIDCYANITALGEAHSGGRASLSGHFQAHLGTSLYSRVDLASSKPILN